MTHDEIRNVVTEALVGVAPELGSVQLAPDRPLRDQVDLDSMDFLRFVVELHKRLGVEVPEADYQKLASLSGTVEYLASRLGGAP